MRHTRLSATALAGPRVPRDALTRNNLYATGSHFGLTGLVPQPQCPCHRRPSPLGLTFPGAATYGSQSRLESVYCTLCGQLVPVPLPRGSSLEDKGSATTDKHLHPTLGLSQAKSFLAPCPGHSFGISWGPSSPSLRASDFSASSFPVLSPGIPLPSLKRGYHGRPVVGSVCLRHKAPATL